MTNLACDNNGATDWAHSQIVQAWSTPEVGNLFTAAHCGFLAFSHRPVLGVFFKLEMTLLQWLEPQANVSWGHAETCKGPRRKSRRSSSQAFSLCHFCLRSVSQKPFTLVCYAGLTQVTQFHKNEDVVCYCGNKQCHKKGEKMQFVALLKKRWENKRRENPHFSLFSVLLLSFKAVWLHFVSPHTDD